MIKEAYVSFEVAKLLKEKGFDEPCFAYYEDDGNFRQSWSNHAIQNKTNPCFFGNAAPTHQMACAWLREEKDIIIVIEPHTYDYPNEKTSSYVFAIWEGDNYIETYSNSKLRGISYLTYEDAVESALKYSLENLI